MPFFVLVIRAFELWVPSKKESLPFLDLSILWGQGFTILNRFHFEKEIIQWNLDNNMVSFVYEEDDNRLFTCSLIFLGKILKHVTTAFKILGRSYQIALCYTHTLVVGKLTYLFVHYKNWVLLLFSSLLILEVKFILLF